MFEGLFGLMRHALHWLRTNPRFVIPSVLSLALGFGGTTVMFAVMYSTLFPPEPYRNPDRLVTIRFHDPGTASFEPATTADFIDWNERNTVFETMGLFLPGSQAITIVGGDYPERILYQYATASMFPMLGVRPQIGVTFEQKPANVRGVVLSDGFWRRRFAADPGVIGRTIQLAGLQFQVLGVMPKGFRIGPVDTDVWRETIPTGVLNDRKVRWLMAVGRMKPGVTIEQARANMVAIAAQLAETYPETNRGWTVSVDPLRAYGSARSRFLDPFVGAVLCVLLLACANVTGLLIAHASGRQRELATRVALGATRPALTRQLIAEAVALSLVSALVGVLISKWWLGLLVTELPPRFEFVRQASLGPTTFLFVGGVSLVAGVVMGLIVAWRSSRPDVNSTLKHTTGGVTPARRQRVLSTLAVAEIALAFTLLVGAGLLLRTMKNLRDGPLGFQTANVLTAEIDLGGPRYRGQMFRRDIAMVPVLPAVREVHARLIQDLDAIPTVESVGLASWLPLARMGSGPRSRTFVIDGQTAPNGERPVAKYNAVSEGFFTTLGIPLLTGRLLTDRDDLHTPWVVVINRAMAERFWPGQNPVGRTITLDIVAEEQPREIVGVVENIREAMNPRWPIMPEMYAHVFQQPTVYPGDGAQNRFRTSILMRVPPSPEILEQMRRVVAKIDPTQPLFQIRTLDEVKRERDASTRLVTLILGLFAGLGTFLAAVGVFSLVSYAARNRSHEFGIRLALGATADTLLRTMLGWSVRLAIVGLVAGGLLAAWQTKLLESILYGVRPIDAATFAGSAVLLALVVIVAALQSARRIRRFNVSAMLRD